LIDVVAQLRSPDGGCPWDLAQTPQTLTYIIEEYEVVDGFAVEIKVIAEELGDLLLQVVSGSDSRRRGKFSSRKLPRHHTKADSSSSPCIWRRKSQKLMKCVKTGSKSKPQKRRNHKHCQLLSAKLHSPTLPPMIAAG